MRILFTLLFFFSSQVCLADDVERFLDQLVTASRSLATVETSFQQEKQVPFLDFPLRASGKLCFSIADKQRPYIFWEYREPEKSGFLFENGAAKLWTGEGGERVARAQEKRFLLMMVEEMLQWISLDPVKLKKKYSLTLVAGQARCLRLTPHKANPFFSYADLCFRPSLMQLETLRFVGKEGEKTVLAFAEGGVNKALSADCRN